MYLSFGQRTGSEFPSQKRRYARECPKHEGDQVTYAGQLKPSRQVGFRSESFQSPASTQGLSSTLRHPAICAKTRQGSHPHYISTASQPLHRRESRLLSQCFHHKWPSSIGRSFPARHLRCVG